MTPRFTHDCAQKDCCTFLGQTLTCDVYISRGGTVILREGDEGPDYRSYSSENLARHLAKDDPEMFHALQLVENHRAK